jgi:hypothetical protein
VVTTKKGMAGIRLLTLTILLFSTTLPDSVFGQTTKVVQVVTGSASVNSTADVVVNTGTSTNLTLPASPSPGRVIQIINHGTGDLLFSDQIWVSLTTNFDYLPSYPNEYRPLISTNSLSIIWDSTNSRWRLLD